MVLHVSRELSKVTVRLSALMADGSTSVGTGFFLDVPVPGGQRGVVLVTNKHVIEGAESVQMRLRLTDENGGDTANGRFVDVLLLPPAHWAHHPKASVDLVAIGIGGDLDMLVQRGIFPHISWIGQDIVAHQREMEELYSAEDILMVGYPNGIWDQKNNLPLMRRGITATAPSVDFDGEPVFMIDCACFPGSSGSPVFLYNPSAYRAGDSINVGTRLKLIGIMFAGPQITASGEIVVRPAPTSYASVSTKLMMNLGLCVKATELDWVKGLAEVSEQTSIAAG